MIAESKPAGPPPHTAASNIGGVVELVIAELSCNEDDVVSPQEK